MGLVKKREVSIGFALFLSFFLLSMSSANALYVTDFYTDYEPGVTSLFTVNGTSFRASGVSSCQVIMNPYVSLLSSGLFDATTNYYSPLSVFRGQSVLTGQTNFRCRDIGTVTGSVAGVNNSYESRVMIQHTADTNNLVKLKSRIICQTNKPTLEIINSLIDRPPYTKTVTDGKDQIPNSYVLANVGIGNVNTILSNYIICNDTEERWLPKPNTVSDIAYTGNSIGFGTGNSGTFIWPFNSSYSGQIHVYANLSKSLYCTSDPLNNVIITTTIDIIKLNGLSATNFLSFTTMCTSGTVGDYMPQTEGFTIDTPLTLTPNSQYFFTYFSKISSGTGAVYMSPPSILNISIDVREPLYTCGAYSECQNGTKTRTCVDGSGYGFPDRIESVTCFAPGEYQELILGFEDVNPVQVDVYECKKEFWTCGVLPKIIHFYVPVGWTINWELFNGTIPTEAMAFITDEEAYEGQRSLEMNYRPPKIDVVTLNPPLGCENVSIGYTSNIQTTDLNATITSNSFTFPSAYPTLSWAVKKANMPRVQYDIRSWFNNYTYCPFPYVCYGDCDTEVEGKYRIYLQELEDNGITFRKNIFVFSGDAGSSWEAINASIDINLINVSALYRILITGSLAEDTYSLKPNRLFFDSFKLLSLEQPLTTTCTDNCSGIDFIDATLVNNTCFTIRYTNDSTCYAQYTAQQELLQQLLQQQRERTNFEAMPFIFGLINETQFNEAGLGWTLNFLSPFFLSLLIIFLLGVFAEYKISKSGSGAGGAVLGIIMIFGMLFLSIAGIAPLWFSIVAIILSGIIVMNKFISSVRGG